MLKIIKFIKRKSTPEKVLSLYEKPSEKGFVFERLWDLVIKFGFCDLFTGKKYRHIIGNINDGKPKKLVSIVRYTKKNKIFSGNSSGCSDITLFDEKTKKYTFISCKYFHTEKLVSKYGVQDIIGICKANEEIYGDDYQIFIIVKNKEQLLERIKNANPSSKYILQHMKPANIMDMKDLTKYYKKLRAKLKEFDVIEDYDEIFGHNKPPLNLYFHQRMLVYVASNLIDEGLTNILFGCKPRSGKTYISGGLIRDLKKNRTSFNTLIITPAPTETAPQFTEDMFEKYQDFYDCEIIHIENGSEALIIEEKLKEKNIIIISKQLLQNFINENKLPFPKFDIVFFDENHFSGTTDLSKQILQTYTTETTIKVYLTATFTKPLQTWNISEEARLYWDIEDEKFCKAKNLDGLAEKHGKDVVFNVIKEMEEEGCGSKEEILKVYDNYPEFCLITNMMDRKRYADIKQEIQETSYGFSFDTLFSFSSKTKNQFKYQLEVSLLLRYISGSKKVEDFKKGDKSIFTRIDNICAKYKSRKPFTQLWFLPPNFIDETSMCLKELIEKDTILSTYDVMIVNSKINEKIKDIKAEINKREIKAKANGKEGLIILAGNMLILGITLNLCDVVMLLNNSLSSDKVMQMSYRCMSEDMDGHKKCGIVVDLNISRVLHTILTYNLPSGCKNKNIEEKMEYLIKGDLINIDPDFFEGKEEDDKIIKKLLDIWKSDPINALKTMLRSIESEIIDMESKDQDALNKHFMTSSSGKRIKAEISFGGEEEDEKQTIKSGKEKDEKDKDEKEKKKKKEISFIHDIIPFVIPFVSILTFDDKCKDFLEMLNMIAKDKELLEIFDDQSMIWWGNSDVIHMIKDMTEKYIDKGSQVYNISINFKLALQSLLDKPKELLELIDDCLKPKIEEKKKFGEVFTPFKLINEMLDKLDEYYRKSHKEKSIFSVKKFKWFDPANGMGNFPIAVYLRLMKGLKNKIKNKEKRKKHILEKMLHMSELNKKNVFVCKQIFDVENKYNLNLYCGDSLELDFNEIWGIEKFDIIIGNPPYNKSYNIGTKNGYVKPFYNEFVEKFIDQCKFLQLIIPSRWFIGGRGLEKFKNNIVKRKDIVCIDHFDDATKVFGKHVLIKGGVNYFLKSFLHHRLCKFNGKKILLSKYDIVIPNPLYYDLIDKVANFSSITDLYCSKGSFGISLTDKNLHNNKKKYDILCYVSKQKGFIKYIKQENIPKFTKTCKVITTTASTANYDCFGNIIVADENEIHSESYISFKCENIEQAKSLASYLKSKLANVLLKLRKLTHNISANTCSWIPLPKLDRIWTDDEIYEYFELSEKQVKLVKNAKLLGYKPSQ